MDMENKANRNILDNNDDDDVIDVKLTVGFLGFYRTIMSETD